MGVVVIPAFEPDKRLIQSVHQIYCKTSHDIIVVNDGSRELFDYFFSQIQKKAIVLRHKENLGKGAAIKTALEYIHTALPHQEEIVFTNADGKLSANDVTSIMDCIFESPDAIFLDRRTSDTPLPFKRKTSNWISAQTIYWSKGLKINIMQTELRGIHAGQIPDLLQIHGSRYDYERNLLSAYAKTDKPIIELPPRPNRNTDQFKMQEFGVNL